MKTKYLILVLSFSGACLFSQEKSENIVPNENLITENIPAISKTLNEKYKKYSEGRGAFLTSVHPNGKELIMATRFASTNQIHKVSQPMGTRKQLTFFDEPVDFASYEPTKGEYLIY